MAQIRTIDGERHNVKETKEELDTLTSSLECLETGVLKVNWMVTITSWEKGEETDSRHYEPVSFIRANIMMYY